MAEKSYDLLTMLRLFKATTDNKMTGVPGTNSVVISGSTEMKQKLNTHTIGMAEGFESVSVIS